MRIYLNDKREAMVETKMGPLHLRELCEIIRKRAGISRCTLELRCEVAYRVYNNFASGKVESLRTGLMALDELGYEVIIRKKKQ